MAYLAAVPGLAPAGEAVVVYRPKHFRPCPDQA
jgi:hypothetical protein